MISQAAMRVMDDNGGTIAGVGYNPGDGPYNPYTALTTYSKYLSYIKRCGDYTGRPYSQCFSNFHTKDGTSVIASNGNWWSFAILRDGTSIRFATQASGTIEIMDVDVNGTKAPNIVGRDIFRLVVYGNTIKPNGPTWNPWAISASINTGDDCTSGAGWTCSEKVINNADYAW